MLLSLALAIQCRQILLGGTFYNADIFLQSIPVYSWYSEALSRGEIPIWSSSILGGFPLAFGQYGFFYPPDMLLFRLLDSTRAFHLSLAIHLALAGWACYWYCRVLGLRRLPSLFAALVFQMGNEVLSWPANGFITKTLFVLPALLAVVELTFRRSPRWCFLVPVIVGAGLLVGYAQILLFALILAGTYSIAIAWPRRSLNEDRKEVESSLWTPQTPRPNPLPPSPRGKGNGPPSTCGRGVVEMSVPAAPWTRHLALLTLLAAGVVLGLGLAAVRVAPTLAVTALSTRAGGMEYARAVADSIAPWALLAGSLLPAVFELPGWSATRPDYVGPAALMMAGLALLSARQLGWRAVYWACVALVATVLSLGSWTPAFGTLLHLPFFSYFRAPGRFTLVAALAVSVLAAYAMDRGLTGKLAGQRGRYITVQLTAVLASVMLILGASASGLWELSLGPLAGRLDLSQLGEEWHPLNVLRPRVALPLLALTATPWLMVGAARGRLSQRAFEGSLVILTVATLFLLGWLQNPWMPPQPLAQPPALLAALQKDSGLYRVFSWAPRMSTYNVGGFYTGIVGSPPSVEFEERYLRQFIPPNLGMMYGVATEDGYEVLQTREQAILAYYMGSDRVDDALFSDGDRPDWDLHNWRLNNRLNLLAALNIRYVLNAFPLDDPRLELVDQIEEQIYPELPATASVYLYRVKAAMPRAFVVPEATQMAGEKAVLDALVSGRVDPRHTVLLEELPPGLDGTRLTGAGSAVEMLEYRDDRVELRARSDGSGFLVLLDAPMPGWSATVDGRPEEILAGNFAGRVVPLRGAGNHLVSFQYQAPLLREGLLASLASLAALMLALVAVWLRGARRPRA